MKCVGFFLSLNDDQLEKVRECGRNMVSPSEIPFIIDVDERSFLSDIRTEGSDIRKAYMKGYTETSYKIHEINREIAEAGSPMAISEIMRSHNLCRNELD